MIAELLERSNLGPNGHHLAKNLHLRLAAFDPKAPRSRCLEANKNEGVSRVRKSLREMMLNPSTGHHPARRNNDGRELRLIDLLRLFCRQRKMKARPLERRAVAADQLFGYVAVLFGVLQKNFDRLDRHGAVTEDRHPRRLA